MLAISALVLALAAPGAPTYRPPRPPAPAETPAAGPDEPLSDDEVRARVASYLGTNDVPSRRAAAVAGLSSIGGPRARELVVSTARSEGEPFAVRAAALHGAPR